MIIIFQGWGALVCAVAAGLIGLALEGVTGSYGLAYTVAGLVLTALGVFFNVLGGDRLRIFWVPIQYWGILVVIGALVATGQ